MLNKSFKPLFENLFNLLRIPTKSAKLYWTLLEFGQATASELAKKSGFKRGNTYALLKVLKEQNLIFEFKKEKKTYFQAKTPEQIAELLKLKNEELNQTEKTFNTLLPSLVSQYKLAVGKPTIKYFEGAEGLKEVFEDIYGPGKDVVWGCVDLEVADKVFPAYVVKKLIPKRIKNEIRAKAVLADSPQAQTIAKEDKKQLRDSFLFDKQKYPLPAEIEVYQDKVAFLSFEKGEFIGLIITNKAFAQSMESLFKIIFEAMKAAKRKKL